MKIHNLSYKLILYIFIIALIVTSFSIYFQVKHEHKEELNKIELYLTSIEKYRVRTLEKAIWNVDEEMINSFIKSIVDEKKVIYIQINQDNQSSISYGKDKRKNIIKKTFKLYKTNKKKKLVTGELILIVDLDPIYKNTQNKIFQIVIIELFEILLFSLLILFLVKKLIIEHLIVMAKYAKKLSIKTLNEPLKINNISSENNEINIVVNSINEMRLNLLNEIKKNKKKDGILSQQSKMASMGEMLGNIAHQWRQPLSIITTASTGIKMQHELKMITDEHLITSLDKITHTAKYLSNTIDDFRNFFKPNKNKVETSLELIFEKTFQLIYNQYEDSNIKFIKDIKNEKINCLENELIQVLINIFNNAKDELIKNENSKLLIFITAYKEDNNVFIKIKDNAGGIPNRIIGKLFEPYFTTKHKSKGTGIGLFMSQEIIKKHMNGEIDAENVKYVFEDIEYKGAQFSIKVPV